MRRAVRLLGWGCALTLLLSACSSGFFDEYRINPAGSGYSSSQ